MYEAREATIGEMCATTGHDVSSYTDPETGWQWCHCGSSTVPIEGEPHDEYTATVANLIDTYVGILGTDFDDDNPSYANLRKSELRVHAYRVLGSFSPKRLQLLVESLKNTDPSLFVSLLRIEEELLDYFIALGVHLDYQWRVTVSTVVLGTPPNLSDVSSVDIILDETNIGLARTAARMVTLMGIGNVSMGDYPQMEKQLSAVCPLLERNQEFIPVAAHLYGTRGVSDETTAQITELIQQDSNPVQLAIADGLL